MKSLKSSISSRSSADRILAWALRACAALSGAVVVLIAVFVAREAAPLLLRAGPSAFLGGGGWHPALGRYGLAPMIVATLATSLGAVLLAAPAGVLSAVFMRFYAPAALASAYRRMVELLAGIPSVVYGFWGLVTVVPLIARAHPPGASLLAGVLILALMIMPTVALTADAALAAVPAAHLRGAAALGFSRWGMIRGVALPAARAGILTGLLLAVGRALGETMAMVLVCGNVVRVPASVFDPVRTLTANIALEMAYATGDHRAALYVSGLALLGVVAALVVAADGLKWEAFHD